MAYLKVGDKIRIEYKGIVIIYNVPKNTWSCKSEYGEYEANGLRKVRDWVDQQKEKAFQRYE